MLPVCTANGVLSKRSASKGSYGYRCATTSISSGAPRALTTRGTPMTSNGARAATTKGAVLATASRPIRDVTCGRREEILARRKAIRMRTLVARREHYRRRRGQRQNRGTGTPQV